MSALDQRPLHFGSVELLNPSGLWLAALLVPLVVLYILKVRRERARVASTWLWSAAKRDLMARAPWKRLVPEVPLLLESAAILALAIALAKPATRGREVLGDHLAIVVDVSASMATLEPKPGAPNERVTRLALAKEAAKSVILELSPGSDAMIIEAGREAMLASPFERDAVRLSAVVDRLDTRDEEGSLESSIALAVDRLKQLGGTRKIVIVTDAALAHPASIASTSIPIQVLTVGSPADNTAIVRIDVRSSHEGASAREEVQAFALVENFGRVPRDVFVTLREDDASDVLASRRVLVKPGERLPVVLTFHPSAGDHLHGLTMELSPHDALSLDDFAYARVPPSEKLPVYLFGASSDSGRNGSPWLERALVSDPLTELHEGTVAELDQRGLVPSDAFVVVDGACPGHVSGTDLLFVNPPAGPCFGATVGASLDRPIITSWEQSDRRLRFVNLDGVHVARSSAIEPASSTQALIRTNHAALAADVSTSTQTATLLGFDVGDSDWPLKASFVLFVRNLLDEARIHRAHGASGPARVGEPLQLFVAGSASSVQGTGPSDVAIEGRVQSGIAVIPPVRRAGLYRFTWQGSDPASVVLPVNLTSEAESNLATDGRVLSAIDSSVVVQKADERPEAHRDGSWILGLIALALLVADVAWQTRKPRVSASAFTRRSPSRRSA